MQGLYDYKKYAVLYVDDEDRSLKSFSYTFKDNFRIYTANNAADATKLLEEHRDEIGVLLTDQQMPGEKGVQLLEKARQLNPRIVRILVTAYTDYDAAINAINTGAIYKYISKPWEPADLLMQLRNALDFYMVQKERDQLLREKLSVLQNMLITDRVVSLGILAAGLSHHVRNALVAVRTFIDLAPEKLREENIDLEKLRQANFWTDFYKHVQQQVHKITEMLFDIGAASDPEPYAVDEVTPHSEVERAIARVKEELIAKKITVENRLPSDLPGITADAPKFSRLFQLLLKDEIISLPEDSKVVFTGKYHEKDPEFGKCVEISVTDNGPGLPAQDLASVFNPFFVRADNPQEFGINLMACYFIVFHHGGKINVKNASPHGTVFNMKFPLEQGAEAGKIEGEEFVKKVLMNEALWEKLLAGA